LKPTTRSILALWQRDPAWRATLAEVREALGAGKREHGRIQPLLEELLGEGRLRRERHRYLLAVPPPGRQGGPPATRGQRGKPAHRAEAPNARDASPVGIFSANPSGFGFVELPGRREALFVPERYIGGALDGDTVQVEYLPARGRQRAAGQIVAVLRRRRAKVRGQVQLEDGQPWVAPFNQKLPLVHVVGAGKLTEGALVEVELTAFPEHPDEAPEGRILQELGPDADAPEQVVLHILADTGLSPGFSPACEAEARALQSHPPPPGKRRLDHRERLYVTIDGEDARDFDDAVCLEMLPNGHRRLLVAIADVAAYVTPGTVLDGEAYGKGTSVYFPNQVFPMLPAALSDDLCSLRPGEPRLALTCEMELGRGARRMGYRIYESAIRSQARLTYGRVQRYFEDGKRRGLAPAVADMLTALRALAAELRTMREERGALNFLFPEYRFQLDAQGWPGEVLEIYPSEATRLIEQLMLEANETVAEHCATHGIPILYRVHDAPPPDQLRALRLTLWNFGITVQEGAMERPGTIKHLLQQAEGHPQQEQVELAILRAMSQARYRAQNDGHFALAASHYTHFTSPIRRYPDLLVHRALKATLGRQKGSPPALAPEAGLQLSTCERVAAEAEGRVIRLYKVLYMEKRLGEAFAATVAGVSERGLWVRLRDEPVDGLLPARELPGQPVRFHRESNRLITRGREPNIAYGNRLTVTLARADRLSQQVDFSFARWGWEDEPAPVRHLPPRQDLVGLTAAGPPPQTQARKSVKGGEARGAAGKDRSQRRQEARVQKPGKTGSHRPPGAKAQKLKDRTARQGTQAKKPGASTRQGGKSQNAGKAAPKRAKTSKNR
jgi:ribonuclease R